MNKDLKILRLRKEISHVSNDEAFITTVNTLTLENINFILTSILAVYKSRHITRDVDMFKMRYGIEYENNYYVKDIGIKHNTTSANVCYTLKKVLNYIRHFINSRYIKKPYSRDKNKGVSIYTHRKNSNQNDIYLKHLLAIPNEQLKDDIDIAAELAGRDNVINKLSKMLNEVISNINTSGIDEICVDARYEMKTMNLDIYQLSSKEYSKEK